MSKKKENPPISCSAENRACYYATYHANHFWWLVVWVPILKYTRLRKPFRIPKPFEPRWRPFMTCTQFRILNGFITWSALRGKPLYRIIILPRNRLQKLIHGSTCSMLSIIRRHSCCNAYHEVYKYVCMFGNDGAVRLANQRLETNLPTRTDQFPI